MCGITGLFSFNEIGRINQMYLVNATQALESRGPDFQDFYQDHWVGLGHRRLSIIDTSPKGNQPIQDEAGRYTIIYNGEIYNYKELKKGLAEKGYSFRSDTDTEVVLKLYMEEGERCLEKVNGFFALAIYDKKEQSMFLARDRMGIKPLLYVHDGDRFIFASEMKALMAYGIKKELNYQALLAYLELNYIPHPLTIFNGVNKCPPGHYMVVKNGQLSQKRYYQLGRSDQTGDSLSYEDAKASLVSLLEKSVQRRLIADVPIGVFLSGGIDSSCITALASRQVDQLNTFSIGYQDEPFFDETHYANEVADRFNTNHQVFSLTNNDLLAHLDGIVNYLDEPFADSSAIPVYILSQETRKSATVALSGDGADEIFSGYNKHYALNQSLQGGIKNSLVTALAPIWSMMPKSRSGKVGNLFRQLERYSKGGKLSPRERYWLWASFNSKKQALSYLSPNSLQAIDHNAFEALRNQYLDVIPESPDLNHFLMADAQLVLPNDMLTKVDLMSMANGLEVRVPFLDHEVVDFAFNLPVEYKIDGKMRKRIVRDAFRDILPQSLYSRAKQGFEVPLLKWFRKELKGELDNVLFNQSKIDEQGVFQWKSINRLRRQLHSTSPGDAHARVWALYVFQKWWGNYVL